MAFEPEKLGGVVPSGKQNQAEPVLAGDITEDLWGLN